MITLHHFTEPRWFFEAGGFEKDENVDLIMPFVELVYKTFGDRVLLWCTINEPEVYTFNGWCTGIFPPGKKDPSMVPQVLKVLMMTHVRMYKTIHSIAKEKGFLNPQVGLVKDIW